MKNICCWYSLKCLSEMLLMNTLNVSMFLWRNTTIPVFFIWKKVLNLYHSLGIFSRRQIDIFLIFPRKQDSTFHANCLLRWQFAWNVKSRFLGKYKETICMKCQILFSEKNKKNISKCCLLKILPRVLSVNLEAERSALYGAMQLNNFVS